MDDTYVTAHEESHEPVDTTQKNPEKVLQASDLNDPRDPRDLSDLSDRSGDLRSDKRKRPEIASCRQIQTWLPRFFRDNLGEPYTKRFRNSIEELIQETERFQISAHKGGKKRSVEAVLQYNIHGTQSLEIVSPGWGPLPQFVPETISTATFNECLKRERLASVCSYHDIKAKKDYFHCIWQVENPAKSDFFRKLPRRTRQQANGLYSDITIPGPIFEGTEGTTWQAIAYPYGYRSNEREGLVGTYRYITGIVPKTSKQQLSC